MTPEQKEIQRLKKENAELISDFAKAAGRRDYLANRLRYAERDIAALLWLDGQCEYCKYGKKETFCGASVWHCSLGNGIECKPKWRGAEK